MTEASDAAKPPRESELDKLVARITERGDQALDTLPISACRKVIDILEARQLDVAMANIAAEFDARDAVLDKGRFEAYQEIVDLMRASIMEKQREARSESE